MYIFKSYYISNLKQDLQIKFHKYIYIYIYFFGIYHKNETEYNKSFAS